MAHEWQSLITTDGLGNILQASTRRPQIIFKHSTRCGISLHALEHLNEGLGELSRVADLHYLDLLTYRPISSLITEQLGVWHQSPQLIIVKDGKVTYHASHYAIKVGEVLRALG